MYKIFIVVYSFFIVLITSCSSSNSKFIESDNNTNVNQDDKALPGYYDQWLYIKTAGSNVLPDMRKYNWEDASLKRNISNALVNVTEYGPTNVGGRIRAMVVDKRDANRLIIGGASGGVFISENKGQSWRAINDQALSPSVTYMDQNQLMPEVIYYCTGEASGNSADLLGAGVFKSTDGGNTFQQLASTNNSNFTFCWSLKCSLNDSNTLYVATHSNGLFRSTDAGASFTKVYNVPSQINDLEVFPDGSVMFTVKGSGVYRSETGNVGTFSKVNSVLSVSTARAELAYCKNAPNIVYAAISGPDNSYNGVLKYFYRSNDGGKNFVLKGNPNGTVSFGFTWYCLTMAVNDNDSDDVFIGSVSVGYSRDGGATWAKGDDQHADNHIAINSGNSMYLGSDGGLCVYNWNNFSAFTSLNNGINITQFYAGDVSPHSNSIIGGTQDNGTKEGRNQNKAFSSIFGGDGGYSFYHATLSDVKYYATQNGLVYRNGIRVSDNLPTSDAKWFIHPFHVSSGEGELLVYPSSNKLYLSKNGGTSYALIGSISTGRLFCANSTSDANPAVYTGGNTALLVIDSVNNTTPIVKDLRLKMPNAIRASFLNCITVVPGYRDKIYLAYSNVSDSGRLYVASNIFGVNPVFKNISGNLPKGLPINWVECDPFNPEMVIFAGTDYGLYITEDGGATWVKDIRLPSTVISSIKIHKNKADIYFFTHGRGVFKGRINNAGISSVKNLNSNSSQVVLYPVPTKENLTISSNTGVGSYKIFDLKGSLILEGTTKSEVETISTADLAEGNYILQFENSEGRVLKKFSVVR